MPVRPTGEQFVLAHAGAEVTVVEVGGGLRSYRHEGRKHIVRRLLAHVGLPVSRLTRTAIGPVELQRMRSGTIRKLSKEELGSLQEIVGL